MCTPSLTLFAEIMEYRLENEGRNPSVVIEVLARLRQFIHYMDVDEILMDYMLWTRIIVVLLQLVSLLDRQLLYRDRWSYNTTKKREGLYIDFVVTHERLTDYDFTVQETYRFIDEILVRIRSVVPSRPNFAFMHRMAELMFACDDFDRMYSILEDMKGMGMYYSDSLTSRLLQLAIGFNYPNAMQLFVEWRVFHEGSVLNAFDCFRILAYYCRSGGGKPCPKCGESFNHRNGSLDHWINCTKPEHRSCSYLQLARTSKGLYNDLRDIPQNSDWSSQAFTVLEFAQQRSITWGSGEWRLFLLCCTFSPRAVEAIEAMEKEYPLKKWDDIISCMVCRLLRFNKPSEQLKLCHRLKSEGKYIHTMVLNEVLLGSYHIDDAGAREMHLDYCVQLMQATGSAPYLCTLDTLLSHFKKIKENGEATDHEHTLVNQIILWAQRTSGTAKRSFWETVPGTSRKHRTYPVPELSHFSQ